MLFWQRTLNLLILSDTSPDNLSGAQDIIARYQVQRVVDAGMLHPSLAYARWRNTLNALHLPYTQVRQGAQITLTPQTIFQVLWPPAHLHKSSNEIHDNALVLRVLTTGPRLLLLGTSALSSYTLQLLANSLDPPFLQAEAVQTTGETGKAFPPALARVLTLAHPSLLLLTTTPVRQHKKTTQAVSSAPPGGPWQTLDGTQVNSLTLLSDRDRWNINLSG